MITLDFRPGEFRHFDGTGLVVRAGVRPNQTVGVAVGVAVVDRISGQYLPAGPWEHSTGDSATRDRLVRWIAKRSSTTDRLDPVTWGVIAARGRHELVIGSPGFSQDWRRTWVFDCDAVPALSLLGFGRDAELSDLRLPDDFPTIWAAALLIVAREVQRRLYERP